MPDRHRRAHHLCALALALALAAPAAAQGVPQQWIFPGLYGQELVAALRSAYTPPSTLGYDRARDVIFQWEQDRNGQLRCVYSGYTITLTPGEDPSSDAYSKDINTEHTWPQSMGAGSEPARSNLHHLFPTRVNVNSSRGNHPYAEIPDAETDTWYRMAEAQPAIPAVAIDEWSEKDNDHPNPAYGGRFEPREDHEGNAARAVFYFWTIYAAQSDADFFAVQKDDLIDWHEADGVDAYEADRNAFVASQQGGKVNPFILDTTLVRRAYGIGWIDGDPDPDPPASGLAWINEIHYDNASTDADEGVEIAGTAGLDLAGWSLVGYNGNGGAVYTTLGLGGTLPDQQDSLGTAWFDLEGLQNGSPDGIALVNAEGDVVQFLSYEGALTAVGGPADGLTSTDVGVAEDGATPAGFSLQLGGTGSAYADFTWQAPLPHTRGGVNQGQTFLDGGPVAAEEPSVAPDDFALVAYPNPFNPRTRLALTLAEAGRVTVAAYDVLGRRVALLHDGPLAAGAHAFTFEAGDLPSGTYLIRAVGAQGQVATRRVTLLK